MRPDHLRPSAQVAAVVAGEGPIGAAPAGPWQQHSGGTRACGVGTSARELPGRGALGAARPDREPHTLQGCVPTACPHPTGLSQAVCERLDDPVAWAGSRERW